MKTKLHCFFFALALLAGVHQAAAQGTAFTYQGRLNDGASAANGSYDLAFSLFNASTGPSQVGGTLTNTAVGVTNGLFVVSLDFGAGVFDGTSYWLQIYVRTNGATNFATLSPRQELTPTPYAIHAENVNATGVSGTILPSSLGGTYGNPVVLNNSNDSFTGSFNGNGAGLTNVWHTAGDAGTVAGPNFLGTTDNQPLELHINGQRALRVEPTAQDAGHSNIVNVIGGSAVNLVASGVYGATISGGGAGYYLGTGTSNSVLADFGTVGGGLQNIIQSNAFESTIGGGVQNTIQTNAQFATIAGGEFHTIQASRGTISGGDRNTIQLGADWATIGGGQFNIHSNASLSAIGGGSSNSIKDSDHATISGGEANVIRSAADHATIGGGGFNTITGSALLPVFSTISGGQSNSILTNAIFSAIGGGSNNICSGHYATVPGGNANLAQGNYSFAAGNRAKALDQGSFIWCDSLNQDGDSQGPNTFNVRASGGVYIFTSAGFNGVTVPAGGGSWSSLSDRNAKENLVAVDARQVLERVAEMPISTWNYKTQDKAIRHLGPMAQDFHAGFAIGEDDKHINTLDEEGVALAAIQGLNQKLDEKNAEIESLKAKAAKVDSLEKRLAELEQVVQSLAKNK